jgi:hypothetical protein
MNSVTRLVAALPLFAVLSACIAIPVGLGGEEPFTEEDLAVIEIGESTKEDIEAAFEQPMQFQDGNIWLYVRAREEAEWAYVWLIPDNPEGTMGDVDFRYLVITFDDNGVVTGYEKSSSENVVGCNQSGVCLLEWSTYMMLAPEEEDQAAKQFDQPADRCGVYVYAGRSKSVTITLDSRRIGGLFDKDYFVFEQVKPGAHRLSATYWNEFSARFDGSNEFSCAAGSSVFIEINAKRRGPLSSHFKVEVSRRDASEGRQAVAEREWIL